MYLPPLFKSTSEGPALQGFDSRSDLLDGKDVEDNTRRHHGRGRLGMWRGKEEQVCRLTIIQASVVPCLSTTAFAQLLPTTNPLTLPSFLSSAPSKTRSGVALNVFRANGAVAEVSRSGVGRMTAEPNRVVNSVCSVCQSPCSFSETDQSVEVGFGWDGCWGVG